MDSTESLEIKVLPNGDTLIEFHPVSFSEFIIDYVYDKESRELTEKMGTRKIYCG